MARPRKPTHLHLLHGTHRKDRHADRASEPLVAEPLGEPRSTWSKERKAIWRELVSMIPEGVAFKSDRTIAELTVILIEKMRDDPANVTPALAAQLRLCLGAFGLTPADRSKVSGITPSSPDPADEFLN